MLNAFREAYEETLVLMKQNKKEVVWDFSPTYVFGLAQMFLARLEKVSFRREKYGWLVTGECHYLLIFQIQNVIQTIETYSVLSKVYINGIETFAKQITLTHDVIVRKKYEHIEPR